MRVYANLVSSDERYNGSYKVKDSLKKGIEKALSKIGFTLKSISTYTVEYEDAEKNDVEFKIKEPLRDVRDINEVKRVLRTFTKNEEDSDLIIDKYNSAFWIKVKDSYIEKR